MKNIFILFLLFISFPLFAQQQEEDSTLFFEDDSVDYIPSLNYLDGWYITPGESFVDATTTYNGRKSLCITSSAPSPSPIFAGYYIRMDDIEADSITFCGNYKILPICSLRATYL